MTRFFADPAALEQSFVVLTGETAAHARVLRMKKGDRVILSDGLGMDYPAVISDVNPQQLCLVVEGKNPAASEPGTPVSVYLGFPKSDKLELVIQKATELGAAEIIAFPGSRCVARYAEKDLEKKLPRWQRIARSAAEQSGRGRIPAVLALSSYEEMLARAARADKAILFYENERARRLSQALAEGFSSVSLITGPEGGFSSEEVLAARDMGLEICTLGNRILRCETAPLCAISAVMYAAGEY